MEVAVEDDIVFEAFLPAVVGIGVWGPVEPGMGTKLKSLNFR